METAELISIALAIALAASEGLGGIDRFKNNTVLGLIVRMLKQIISKGKKVIPLILIAIIAGCAQPVVIKDLSGMTEVEKKQTIREAKIEVYKEKIKDGKLLVRAAKHFINTGRLSSSYQDEVETIEIIVLKTEGYLNTDRLDLAVESWQEGLLLIMEIDEKIQGF